MYIYRAIGNTDDFLGTLGESLLYGLIIAKKVMIVNEQSSTKYTHNCLILTIGKTRPDRLNRAG